MTGSCKQGNEPSGFLKGGDCHDQLNNMLIRKKSDTTQFLWVTVGPTYKLTTDKLSVQYVLFTYVSICSF
jgi:hypothetical protein